MDNHSFHQWVNDHRDEIIETTRKLLRINSVGADETGHGRPFGDGLREALDFVLQLGDQSGFRTQDLQGYAGHVEYGDSEDYIAVLSHLDVVPAGRGWTYPPFGAEIHDGKIYARGAIDDKGPGMSAFFALRAIKELGLPLKKRVRLIYGCNEENPIWRCMNHYFAHEPKPIGGFTPDAEFPLIYAEKGILSLSLQYMREPENEGNGRLLSIEGGERENMVPDRAVARVVPPKTMSIAELNKKYEDAARQLKLQVELGEGSDGCLQVVVQGISAHGSLPHLGVNAVSKLADLLLRVSGFEYPWLSLLAQADPDGISLGIACQDEVTGALTSNLGVVTSDENCVDVIFNIRYPVDQTAESLIDIIKAKLEPIGWHITNQEDMRPLYVPKDSVVVDTLAAVYEQETGQPADLLTIGGGTYARAIPNAVAFGALFPGQEELAHQKDEYWAVEDLLRVTAIYANAIYQLSNADWSA